MVISKYNPEGYFDPTPHEALTNIEVEHRAARLAKAAPYDTAGTLCAEAAFPSRRTSISRGFWMKPIRRTVNWGCLWAECC